MPYSNNPFHYKIIFNIFILFKSFVLLHYPLIIVKNLLRPKKMMESVKHNPQNLLLPPPPNYSILYEYFSLNSQSMINFK